MLPSQHWASNFTVDEDDIEYLTNLLLERETPLSSTQLARNLVERRLQEEADAIEERYRDVYIYNPAESYEVGQRILFPALDFATAVVKEIRPGENEAAYGDFNVLRVAFEEAENGGSEDLREFAANLEADHPLSASAAEEGAALLNPDQLSADDIMEAAGRDVIIRVEAQLQDNDGLVSVARRWFPHDLILTIDEGHLNLAEAVLDIAGGGPLNTADIIEQIGGLGESPQSLQEFSLNYAMKADDRFDEVGPTGEVLWYLVHMEPEEVQGVPKLLQYTPIEYDRSQISIPALDLEEEIGDELSPLDPLTDIEEGTITLIYPHRRAGTLPINLRTSHIFPTAERSPRVWLTLVDGQDDEEYTGWVVPEHHYVYGLGELYRKYSLPVGAYVTVSQSGEPGKIRIDFNAHRAHTEWVRLMIPKGEQINFENSKRAIGADYDDLMILGIDDLQALDETTVTIRRQRKSLSAIMRLMIPGLARLSPQGTVHAKTIYSAVNVIRRCPPGPLLTTLEANPDFENVGGHYWKLADD